MSEKETDELTTTGLRVPRKIFINDMISGLIMAIVTIPGAIANGVLAGINPVYGLYTTATHLAYGPDDTDNAGKPKQTQDGQAGNAAQQV